MATSRCPKCESTRFEMATLEPKGARYKQSAIQCSSCGAVVGVTGFFDAGFLLKEQEAVLQRIDAVVTQIAGYLSRRG